MRIHRMLAVGAVAALLMLGTSVAKADGANDPHAKITVPTDPDVIVPCSQVVNENTVCFTEGNSISDPAPIQGPDAQTLATNPLFDITTNFFYEPDNCGSSDPASCPITDVLNVVYLAVIPTISNAPYTCSIGAATGGAENAFNGCTPIGVTPPPGYDLILELTCVSTPNSPCTGMLPGQEGSSEVTPEPGTLMLLGIAIPLVGLVSWKRRKALELGRHNQANLAAC
jgi:PEP-CTERM motif